MRVETNRKLVRRNRRIAQYLFFFSLAVLIGGFIVANQPVVNREDPNFTLALLLPSLVLPVGFISTLVSVRMTNLWVRQPRPEQAIQEALKGINKKSVLYNYYHFPARHVLIAPQGVFAMITRFQDGRYQVKGDKWQTYGGLFSAFGRFFRRDDIGNPTEEAMRAADHVKRFFEPFAPDIEVQPLILFVDPRARLEINDPVLPVLYTDDKQKPNLKDYMRDLAQQQKQKSSNDQSRKKGKARSSDSGYAISPEEIEGLAEAFEQATLPGKRKKAPEPAQA